MTDFKFAPAGLPVPLKSEEAGLEGQGRRYKGKRGPSGLKALGMTERQLN